MKKKESALDWDQMKALTAAQVAELLQVHTRTVHKLIHRGELQAKKVGRDYRIPRLSYEAYLKAS